MADPFGAGATPLTIESSNVLIPPAPEIITLLDAGGTVFPPPVGGQNPDVYGNNAYFNNINLQAPPTIGGQVVGSLIPTPPHTLDLGSAANPWRTLYVDSIVPNMTPLSGLANLLTNGGFEVWQRLPNPVGGGTVFGANQYSADRWYGTLSGGVASFNNSIVRDTVNVDIGSHYCWFASSITANATDTCMVQQVLTDIAPELSGVQVSFSVRVKSTNMGSGAVIASLYADNNAGGGGGTSVSVNSQPYSGSGGYETLSATMTMPNPCNYAILRLFIYRTGNLAIDNAMMVVGPNPVPFVPISPNDDLVRCNRYCQKWGPNLQQGKAVCVGQVFSTSNAALQLPMYGPSFPLSPTFTFSLLSDWGISGPGGANQPLSALILRSGGVLVNTIDLQATTVTANLTPGYACWLNVNATTAWMLAEWNP